MIAPVFAAITLAVVAGAVPAAAAEGDARTPVRLPAEMRADFLAEMRQHMDSLDDVIAAVAAGNFKDAAKVAREHLVPGSGKGFGRHLPIEFREIGLGMHRAAAEFAEVAEAAGAPPADADWRRVMAALKEISGHCRACHDAFRVE
jgi:cytochrome c556